MVDPSVSPAPPSKTPLKVFGVLGILLGVLSLALGALLLVMAFYTHNLPNGQGLPIRAQMPGVMVYCFAGFLFASLGWGTFMARRWARTLSLIVGWSWLLVGVMSMCALAFMVPSLMNPPGGSPLGPGGRIAVVVITFLVVGFFFIALPAIGLVFYHLPKTQRAFETFHPEPDWTDRCPPSVLAVSLCYGVGGIFVLVTMPFINFGWPFFGRMLWGWRGLLALLVQSPVLAYLAWGTYHLRWKAWVLSMVVNVLWTVSVVWTFWSTDLLEMDRQMGFSEQVIAQVARNPMMSGPMISTLTGFACVLWLGYLLWIGRHFKRD